MLPSIATAHEALALALIVLGLAVILGLVALMYRRRYFSARVEDSPALTLTDIRRMREDGQLSDEEYERMRQVVLGADVKSRGDPGVQSQGRMES